jgi:predicted metal-dependent hydrolase
VSGPTVTGPAATGLPATIRENGRAKAYRPLPAEARRAALARALEAYGRGDFFLAHELLEPAWMGAKDPGERALHSGLIKLAAAFVHAVRGNPAGVEKNLAGARIRLSNAARAGRDFRIDVPELLAQVDACRAVIARDAEPPPIEIHRLEDCVPCST